MSSSMHPFQDVMAGQAILRTMPFGFNEPPIGSPVEDNPDSTVTPADITGIGYGESFQVVGIDGINLIMKDCAGCTMLPGLLTLSTDVVLTVDAKSDLANFDDVHKALAALRNTTPGYATDNKSALAICRDLLSARRGLLTTEQVVALENQLNSLLADDDELEASGITISPTSLDGLIEFLAMHLPDVHPNISVSREGRFTASWLHGKKAKITLSFDQEGGDWVGVDLRKETLERKTGAFVINSLAGIAQPFRSWIKA